MMPAGSGQAGLGRQLRLAPALLTLGTRDAGRTIEWFGT